ncbi:peptidylprolyl isomerase [Gracilimonas tropica]|uniref:peptidylprolyl isomerase n=1 Tax=Gracilimonas tropica TaxID=454600 RepID=UPI000381DD4E|nr:peptidylprolyl isomerase [Gracilimonas tropica]
MNLAMVNTSKFLILGSLLFLLTPKLSLGQSNANQIIVGEVGNADVTFSELQENYTQGMNSDVPLEELQSFLPIYLDYKAKLLAAKDQGYYDDSTLVVEHNNYVKQAAYAWWLEKEIKPSAFETFKERSEVELKPYHVLIALDENATEQQINDAIAKLEMARTEIQQGVPLKEVDQKYSTKRGGRSMGGDIPWISAGRTVQPFEDTLYGMDVGEVSKPFRTQFGYHIAVLQDKRERKPARLTSHIYVRGTGDSTSYDKIHEAYDMLERGRLWSEVVPNYSEDGASVRNNGRIGWVSYQSNFAMDFVDAVMQQDPDQAFSEPVQTNYGYHIFKIDSVESYATEAEKDKALMSRLQDTPYYQENNQFVIDYLVDNYGTESNSSFLNQYEAWLLGKDSTALADLSFPADLTDAVVFSFSGNKYNLNDFHSYLQDRFGDRLAINYRENWFENFKRFEADKNLINLTLDRYPQFEDQSENYLNGLVVYNINEDYVWSAATVDTSRLRSIYQNNLDNYRYKERPFYYLVTARHDSTLKEAISFVNEGGELDSLSSKIANLGVSSDSTSGYSEPPFDRLQGMDENSFSEIFEYNNRKAVFWLEDILPARNMTFEEAFNRLLSEFQPQREQEWLEELRETYNVKVYPEKLKEAYQRSSR